MPHNMLLSRVRAEYLEMPGLRLTLDQAQRLCGVERALCKKVFDALVAEKFLHVASDGAFARPTEGAIPRRRPVNADLRTRQRVATAS
jgi:hypothetical protein